MRTLSGGAVCLLSALTSFRNSDGQLCKVSKKTWCLTSTETIRLIRDGLHLIVHSILIQTTHCFAPKLSFSGHSRVGPLFTNGEQKNVGS